MAKIHCGQAGQYTAGDRPYQVYTCTDGLGGIYCGREPGWWEGEADTLAEAQAIVEDLGKGWIVRRADGAAWHPVPGWIDSEGRELLA